MEGEEHPEEVKKYWRDYKAKWRKENPWRVKIHKEKEKEQRRILRDFPALAEKWTCHEFTLWQEALRKGCNLLAPGLCAECRAGVPCTYPKIKRTKKLYQSELA